MYNLYYNIDIAYTYTSDTIPTPELTKRPSHPQKNTTLFVVFTHYLHLSFTTKHRFPWENISFLLSFSHHRGKRSYMTSTRYQEYMTCVEVNVLHPCDRPLVLFTLCVHRQGNDLARSHLGGPSRMICKDRCETGQQEGGLDIGIP